MIHEVANEGFAKGADAYERGRPSYPDAAIAHLVDRFGFGPGSTVVDLGAGTGKFSGLVAATGAHVVAVEPVDAMRETLRATRPDIDARDGTGEAIPLPDASADVVTVAQAFHWFRHDEALTEIARVLRPGGGLALVWNQRDESVPWVARMSEIIEWHKSVIPRYETVDWPEVVARSGTFDTLELATFPYAQLLDRAGLAERVRSVSYVARLPEHDQARLVDEVVALTDGFAEPFELPYVTLVYTCRRR